MSRFAVGGFQHETNTFAETKASWSSFVDADFWPGLTVGKTLSASFHGLNIPVAGAMAEFERVGHEVVPLAWCSAVPSAYMEDTAFRMICELLLERLRAAVCDGPLDGLFLDLHGAAVTESFEDGEGELLLRLRSLVGERLPIAVSLDLHANLSREIIKRTEIAVAYRTYPHVDMAETGASAARFLMRLARGWRPAKAFIQIPFLIPEIWQCTLIDPARSIYEFLKMIEAEERAVISFCPGFPLSDIRDCGPTVIAYADDATAANRAARKVADAVIVREAEFRGSLLEPDLAVSQALQRQGRRSGPVILADVQDNPGGGGNADTVGLLHALVRYGADAVSALHCDPVAASSAHQAGMGGEVTLMLGVNSARAEGEVFKGQARVERLGDGRFVGTGPMYRGSHMDLGPMALLRILGHGRVRVIVSTRKFQAADQSLFRHVGVEPAREAIIALKSQVHFRADFQGIADEIVLVRAPGPVLVDTAALPWRRLRRGLRLAPLGPVWNGAGSQYRRTTSSGR